MASSRIARSHLQSGKWHQGFVGCGWRAVIFSAQCNPAFTNGWSSAIAVERSLRAPGLYFAFHIVSDRVQHFFERVQFIDPRVNYKAALRRHNVVRLVFSSDGSNSHFHGTEQIGNFFKLVGAEPFDIFHRFVNGIFSFFAGCMTGTPCAVQSSTINPLSATAICICVGSPTIAPFDLAVL